MECFTWLLAVAVIWLIVREIRTSNRIAELKATLESQQALTSALVERIAGLRREMGKGELEGEKQAEAGKVIVAPPELLTPVPSPIAHPSPGRGAPPPSAVDSPLSRSGGSAMGEGGKGGEESRPPLPFPSLPQPIPKPSFDWENLVGVRLFSWMAGIMLAIGAILFLRYSIQHGWLSAPVRMAIGILTGAGLLVLCEWKAARRYPVTANALDAAGIAILFSTIFASHTLWQLLNATAAFLLMALVAAVAVALAIRRDSPFIAVLGLLGGFATPALLSTGEDRPITLFGYLLLLNAGLAWVALSRRWVILIRLALAFTFLYQWAWVLRFLDPDRIPLAFGIFLIFPILYLIAPALVRRSESADEPFWQVASLSAGLPLLLAVYLAAAPGFGEHYGLLFGYLLLLGAGLAVFAAVRGPELLHTAVAAATALVYGIWLLASYRSAAWPEVLAFLSAEVLLYLAAPWLSQRLDGRLLPGQSYAALLLLALFPVLVFVEPAAAVPPWLMLGALALLALAFGMASLALRLGGLQAAALVAAHGVVLTWMIAAARMPWTAVALGAEAVLAAFGVAWIPLARKREGEEGLLTRTCAKGAVAGLFAAQIVALVAGWAPEPPSIAPALPLQAGLLIALLVLAWRFDWPGLAPASVPVTFLAAAAYWNDDGPYWDNLALATVIFLIYLAYPLALGRRARSLRQPWLAAVLASVAFFFLARLNLEKLGYGDVIGLLPLLEAAALAVLLWKLMDLEPAEERDHGRLALVAGAVLAFVTVAIPLQLEKQWITIGWALLAAALAWLYTRIPHRGLLLWIAGLAAAVFVRLSLNRAVLSYHPRAELPIWNWYLYTYLVVAAALLGAAWFLSRTDDRLAPSLPRLSTLVSAAGGVLLFLLLNIEIADYFSTGPALTFSFLSGQASLAEGLTYTLGWGIFALVLLMAGIAVRSRGARIAAIGLLLATVLKGFLLDLAALGGLYRVASFVGLAICLAAVAVLIQKFVILRMEEE